MNTHKRHQFLLDIISYAVWLYHRFNLSYRDIENFLTERGITVFWEINPPMVPKALAALMGQALHQVWRAIRQKIETKAPRLWRHFVYRRSLRQHQRQAALSPGTVDQEGEVVDVYLQARRDGTTAKRVFRRLVRSHGGDPRKMVTDKLRSYGVAHQELMPEVIQSTQQRENNRAEQSHEATRVRERKMRKFKSVRQAEALNAGELA